jgi:hypothetical protein
MKIELEIVKKILPTKLFSNYKSQFLNEFAPRGKVFLNSELGPQGYSLIPRGNVHPFVHPYPRV